jgi:hypothetical protein
MKMILYRPPVFLFFLVITFFLQTNLKGQYDTVKVITPFWKTNMPFNEPPKNVKDGYYYYQEVSSNYKKYYLFFYQDGRLDTIWQKYNDYPFHLLSYRMNDTLIYKSGKSSDNIYDCKGTFAYGTIPHGKIIISKHYKNSAIKKVYHYDMGIKHGLYRYVDYRYDDSTVVEEGWYCYDERCGEWKFNNLYAPVHEKGAYLSRFKNCLQVRLHLQ